MAIEFTYTDKNYTELGYILKGSVDIENGKYEVASNDFEITLNKLNWDTNFNKGAIFFCNDSEYGGIVDSMKVETSKNTVILKGPTYRGLLEKEFIQPPNGQSHLVLNKEANTAIQDLISGKFDDLYVVDNVGLSDITVNYQIRDYNLLEALETMLYKADIPSRLDIKFYDGKVHLQALPIIDLSELLQVDDSYGLSMTVETPKRSYNHILCLGKGEMTERLRINLYLKSDGTWTTTESESVYTGLNRNTYKYEDTNQEDATELTNSAIKKVSEENGTNNVSIDFTSDDAELFDIVGAKEEITGIYFKEQITKKILRATLNDNIQSVKIEYKVGD